jgi:flagellar protein FliS
MNPQGQSAYLKNQVMSASPAQLILCMYDGLIRFLSAAHGGFSEADTQKRFETIHNNLIRSQNILTELESSLDLQNGGEIAGQLSALYRFCGDTIRKANSFKDPVAIKHVIHMISELREAWSKAAAVETTPTASAPEVRTTVMVTG